MTASDLINWNQLSKLLCGSTDTLRRNRIPKIHKAFIDDLIETIDRKITKHRLEHGQWKVIKTRQK